MTHLIPILEATAKAVLSSFLGSLKIYLLAPGQQPFTTMQSCPVKVEGNFIKILKFCAKDIIKKVNDNPQNGRKIFANYVSDEGLVYRIYKEHLQLNNKKTNNPI